VSDYREGFRCEFRFRLERAEAAIRFVVLLVALLRIAFEAFAAITRCVRIEFLAMVVVLFGDLSFLAT